jgi:DNA-binding HxlR family transcriptional regulator
MKYTWKGKWHGGEIIVEVETVKELEDALRELGTAKLEGVADEKDQIIPEIPSMLGCTDAVRVLMEAEWGRRPKAMSEIKRALELNELYFSKEALAATLVTMVKKGGIHRTKEEGKWKYFTK